MGFKETAGKIIKNRVGNGGEETLYHGTDRRFTHAHSKKSTYPRDGYPGATWTTTKKKTAKGVARARYLTGGKNAYEVALARVENIEKAVQHKDPKSALTNDPMFKEAAKHSDIGSVKKLKSYPKKILTRKLPRERRVIGHVHELDPKTFTKPDPQRMKDGGATNAMEHRHLVPNYRVSEAEKIKVLRTHDVKEGRFTRPLTQKEADIAAVGVGAAGVGAAGHHYHKTQETKRGNHVHEGFHRSILTHRA